MTTKTVLDYAAVRKPWFPWRLLLLVAASSGAIYWRLADWWAYVDEGNGKQWPKFELPIWWQVIESSMVGIAVAGLVGLVWFAARRRTSKPPVHHKSN